MADEAPEYTAIKVEKRLCAALGKEWRASGMSVETLADEAADEIERLRGWLGCIHDLLDEEIGVRFRTSSHKTEEQMGRGSTVYAMISPFRNMARSALKGEDYIKKSVPAANHKNSKPSVKCAHGKLRLL